LYPVDKITAVLNETTFMWLEYS